MNFVKQYDQFGLKQTTKLTGAGFLTEPDVLPAQGKSALGIITGHFYSPLLDNPTNKKFVKDFRAQYGGKMPDGFACQGYDTAEVIVRALRAVNGNTQDKDKLVDAIAKVEFDSPRGRFRFDPKTHNVIQPFIYIREGGRDGAGPQQRAVRQGRQRARPRHRLHPAGLMEPWEEGAHAPLLPRSYPLVAFVPDIFGQALNGLAYGVLLFLLSVGLTLIFGMLDVVNLAHGSYYMLGAYAGLTLIAATGNFWLALAGRARRGGAHRRCSSSGHVSARSTGAARSTRCS